MISLMEMGPKLVLFFSEEKGFGKSYRNETDTELNKYYRSLRYFFTFWEHSEVYLCNLKICKRFMRTDIYFLYTTYCFIFYQNKTKNLEFRHNVYFESRTVPLRSKDITVHEKVTFDSAIYPKS